MADYKVTDTQLSQIASAIRTKGGTSAPLVFPSGFVSAINAIPSGGSAVLSDITISSNGSYSAAGAGVDGFANVVVNVSGGGGGSNDNFLIAIGAKTGSVYDTEASVVEAYGFVSRYTRNGQYGSHYITGVEMTAVEAIWQAAFYSCMSLTVASFPLCTSVGAQAFYGCTSLNTISFPECIFIDKQAFLNCDALTGASFPKCTELGEAAFSGCDNLATVSIPLCTTIGSSAFSGCKSLAEASFSLCEYIGTAAFSSCVSLSTAYFPACTTIAQQAFYGCSRLMSIYILASSVATLQNSNAFNLTPIVSSGYTGAFGSIFVPASLVDAYKAASRWSTISDRITAYVE